MSIPRKTSDEKRIMEMVVTMTMISDGGHDNDDGFNDNGKGEMNNTAS
jgi:hypothetical protein